MLANQQYTNCIRQEQGYCSIAYAAAPTNFAVRFFFNIFLLFLYNFFVLYSALLHLPPLRFNCADGCWDRTYNCCNWCICSRTL
jgi:hypothetical protein